MRGDARGKGRIGVLSLAAAFALSIGVTGPVTASPRVSGLQWLTAANAFLNVVPGGRDLTRLALGPSTISLGADGRLTMLVVGSDFRYSRPNYGERLDTVMVVTINPQTKQMAALSIPRDTGNLPLPNGDTWKGKVNSLLRHYKEIYAVDRDQGLEYMRLGIAHVLAIEIDYVAYARFQGFDLLVDALGGVRVNIPAEIRDPRIWDHPTNPNGAKFLAGTNVVMGGASAPRCYAMLKPIDWSQVPNCKRALMLVRSRHGRVGDLGNSDWKRSNRQQQFLRFALREIIGLGNGAALKAFSNTAQSQPADVYTSLPLTDADLLYLFDLFSGAYQSSLPFQQVVLKPRKWAFHVPFTTKYELKISAVRALTATWFGPIN